VKSDVINFNILLLLRGGYDCVIQYGRPFYALWNFIANQNYNIQIIFRKLESKI